MNDKPEVLVRPCVVAGDYPLLCNIRNFRVKQSMSAVDLGRKVQLNPQAISDLETGLASPKLTTAFKLADALGVEVADLYVRGGQRPAAKTQTLPTPKKLSVFGVSIPPVLTKKP